MNSDIDFAAHMHAVAAALLGKPNPHLSKGSELRFGTNGSMSVDLKKGTFFSHEDNQGGGTLDLIKREKGLEGAEALEFMRQSGCDIPDTRRPANGNNGSHHSSAAKPEFVEGYDYVDEAGKLLFQVCRFRNPKTFRQRRPDGRGGWINNMDGVRRVPYRLDKIAAARTQKVVLIVEGEKDVHALEAIGCVATTNPGGVGKWAPEYSDGLRDAKVTIIPDNDAIGHSHARVVAAGLIGIATEVKLLDLAQHWPEMPPKADVSDWLKSGGGTKGKLIELWKNTPVFVPGEAPGSPSRRSPEVPATPAEPTNDGEWPESTPLPAGLLPVKPFDPQYLPASIAPWVADISDRMQCPTDYVAIAALVAMGSLVGPRIGVRPLRRDNWCEVPNLWGCIVGRPGALKSPAMSEALAPLHRLDQEAQKRNEASLKEFELAHRNWKLHEEAAAQVTRAAFKKGAPGPDFTEQEPERPKQRRYITNDLTYEALGQILADNPDGTLVYRDELVSLLKTLDREDNSAARGFYLSAWIGKNPYTFDRIQRGRVAIDRACISLLGSTQPGRLQEYVHQVTSRGAANDGLLQRFGLLVWPDQTPEWHNVDRYPNAEAKNRAWATFEHLSKVTPEGVEAEKDLYDHLPFLRFSEEAAETFQEWRGQLERLLRSGDISPAAEEHFSKYRKLVPGLALINHLADGGVGPIEADALIRAIGLSEYLKTHANRAYGSGREVEGTAAKAILARIRKGDLRDGFTARDIRRREWSGLTDNDLIHSALEMLETYNWIVGAAVRGPGPGRQKTSYRINPREPR
jgi:hypothetical protein